MAGQVWSVAADGGYLSAKNLSKVLRMAVQPLCKFRQFADVKDATAGGKHTGAIFTWDVILDVATAGAALTEGVAIPQTKFTVTQASLTMTEIANSVPWSGKLETFSEMDVKTLVQKTLKNDCVKVLDAMAYAEFNKTLLTAEASGGTSATAVTFGVTGVAASVNNVAMSLAHVKKMEAEMKDRNIPAYIGDDYILLGRASTFEGVKDGIEEVAKYTDSGFQILFSGEKFRYRNTRIVEQSNIGSAGFSNGKTDNAFMFGEDTVVEAVAVPEELRAKIPDDFGRGRGIAWYYVGGFGLVHNQTGAKQNRVMKWTSLS